MQIDELLEIYDLVADGSENAPIRKQAMQIRKNALSTCISSGFKKLAFDTRRIDQESEFIPRRGLQNYHRSEQFISKDIGTKLVAFAKLKNVLESLKLEFGKQPEWQDSYVRVLHSSVNKGLRTDQSDGDYSDAQPAMASLDYLEELMYVRYRLTTDNLMTISENDLRNIIMKKDELLSNGDYKPALITPSDVSKYSYEQMMDKMLHTMSQMMYMGKFQQNAEKMVDVKETSAEKDKTITITIKV